MKNWLKRNKPIWIGGLILGILFFSIFSMAVSFKSFNISCDPCKCGAEFGLPFKFYIINYISIQDTIECKLIKELNYLNLISDLFIWFIIGALIGLIIQKVRKRKKRFNK